MNNVITGTSSPVEFSGSDVVFDVLGVNGTLTIESINALPEINANQSNITLGLTDVAVSSDGADAVVFGPGGDLGLTNTTITNTVGTGVVAIGGGMTVTLDSTSTITAAGTAIGVTTGDLVVNNNGGTIESTGGLAISGGDGNDTVNSSGTIIGFGGTAISLDGGSDIVNLTAGSVTGDVLTGAESDTITASGADIAGNLNGGADNDTISVTGGSAADVLGGGGLDIIDISGGTVANVSGGDGADSITLSGTAVVTGNVSGDGGDDTISVTGGSAADVLGGVGADTLVLSGGSLANASGGADADTITLSGTSVSGDLSGDAGDDTFTLSGGSFGGSLLGGDGDDTATIEATFDLSTISTAAGSVDGGTGAEVGGDRLTVLSSGTLTGESLTSWEFIDIGDVNGVLAGPTLALDGASLVAGQVELFNGSTLDLGDGMAITGDFFNFDPGSTLIAATAGGTGVFSVSGVFLNDGVTDMSGATPAVGDVLTVGGAYDVLGGSLFLDANLDDTLLSDRLVLNGEVLGPANISIIDLGGDPSFTGAGPGNGILLVDASGGFGLDDGDFVLAGGDITKVPFTYSLFTDTANGQVLLQSDVLSQVYGVAILGEVMREEFPILRERLGEKRYNSFGDSPEVTADDNAGIWARIDGMHREIEGGGSFTSASWDQDRGEVEVGLGIPMPAFGGAGVFGVSVHAIYSDSDVSGGSSSASVDSTGFGAGMSFAWFGGGGLYVDAQGRISAWDNDIDVSGGGVSEEVDGVSWGASLEVGNRFAMGTSSAVIPRLQTVYTDTHFDDFTDGDGVEFSQDDSASLIFEAGVTVEALVSGSAVLFGDVAVSHDVLSESSVNASGFNFESGMDDTWGTVALGVSSESSGGTSFYLQGEVGSALGSNFADSYGYGIKAGVRIAF